MFPTGTNKVIVASKAKLVETDSCSIYFWNKCIFPWNAVFCHAARLFDMMTNVFCVWGWINQTACTKIANTPTANSQLSCRNFYQRWRRVPKEEPGSRRISLDGICIALHCDSQSKDCSSSGHYESLVPSPGVGGDTTNVTNPGLVVVVLLFEGSYNNTRHGWSNSRGLGPPPKY